MLAVCFQKYVLGNLIVRSFEEPPKELGLSKQLKACTSSERQLKLEILHDATRRTSRKKLSVLTCRCWMSYFTRGNKIADFQ